MTMLPRIAGLALAVLAAAVLAVVGPAGAPLAAQAPAKVDFGRDIQPLFQQHCVGCHGASQQTSGLRLDRRRDAMRGSSASGVVIRPGNADISFLYLKLTGGAFGAQMPPTGALKPEQIALVKRWIDEGAEWPDALAGDVAPPPPDPGAVRLIEAITSRDRAAIDRALAHDRDAIGRHGRGGATPLMAAALAADVTTVRALLDAGADPNATNDAGVTAVMWAVPDLPTVSLLLDRGADANVRSRDQRTPLMRAAGIHGAVTVVRRLLDAGADPQVVAPGLFGPGTALTEAAHAGDAEIIQLLIARGADGRADGPAPLYFALRANCAACEEALIKITPPPLLGVVATLLGPPAGNGRHLDRLLARGIDVNGRDPEGRTLLMLAANADTVPVEAVRTLIAKGADLNAASKSGLAPLDYARQQGQTAVVEALLAAGARSARTLPAAPPPAPAASPRDAIVRSLPLLQQTDATFWKKAGCVSCHNNTLTAETIAAARRLRLPVDETTAARQRSIVAGYVEAWRERALQGLGIPGDADTVSYILLGLAAEGHKPDAATDALTRFLLDKQAADGQWFLLAHRPPIESSEVEVTASSMRALQIYGARHGETATRAIRRAADWIAQARTESNEDRVFRLLGLTWAADRGDALRAAARALIAAQRPDGGWAQLPTLESDAYATGQALVALATSGVVPRDDPSRRKGVDFLMKTQLADGSWFVRSRAIAIQPFFEADFPHGRDQFISAAATNWAARALTLDLQ
jgi:ankyrin repeat protein